MLSEWFIEQEKQLDKHLLHSMEQEYQKMSSMLLRHADKSRAFDTRSPEDFRACLEDVRDDHCSAKSQLEAYSSGEVDISVKDRAFTTLKEVNGLLKSLKEALNKHLSKVRESTRKIQKEFGQSYNKLLLYAEQSSSFTDQEPEEFKKKLERIEGWFKAASSQIEKYLSGTDSSEENGRQAFKI